MPEIARPCRDDLTDNATDPTTAQQDLYMPHWTLACATDDIETEDVIRFDHDGATYAIYRAPDDRFYATAGRCTDEDVHLERDEP